MFYDCRSTTVLVIFAMKITPLHKTAPRIQIHTICAHSAQGQRTKGLRHGLFDSFRGSCTGLNFEKGNSLSQNLRKNSLALT